MELVSPKYNNMFKRILSYPKNKSFFLFGPRGVGKTTWLKSTFTKSKYINLLKAETFTTLLANPSRLSEHIPHNFSDWIIIDEVQKIPALLDEVHRLIEEKKYKFILTGSSARKLKNKNVNLLAGRALKYNMYPLTHLELGKNFSFSQAIKYGSMPMIFSEEDKLRYLQTYVMTYLEEEVKQEGLTRNIGNFSRFLEVASFSQAAVINMSEIARETSIHRKVIENYFSILEDLLIAYFLKPFTKRQKRKQVRHNKFYFFDVGVFRTLRPKGPYDFAEEIEGVAIETLIFHELKSIIDYERLNYEIFFWRTIQGHEVDFVLYGEKNIIAFEVKRKTNINNKDLSALKIFIKDYPQAKAYLIYGGQEVLYYDKITLIPFEYFFKKFLDLLK
jgi:uncharacterized protein